MCVRGDFWPAQCADPYVLQGLLFAGIVPVDHEPERSGGVVDVTTVLSEDDLYESPHVEYEYICIEVTLLKGYERRELVYDEHRFAKVLCDAQGNCATKGHMVVFQDAPMMMSTYCAGKCTERVAKVNSPRWTRGLRVPSKKIGLSFTAFAARHGTNIEETFLAAAVRVGL